MFIAYIFYTLLKHSADISRDLFKVLKCIQQIFIKYLLYSDAMIRFEIQTHTHKKTPSACNRMLIITVIEVKGK